MENLLDHWRSQGIYLQNGNESSSVDEVERRLGIHVPDDFRTYFSAVNGMGDLYPNWVDDKGYLFYPLEFLISAGDLFPEGHHEALDQCFIFADFLQECWYYGCIVDPIDKGYSIILISHKFSFSVISNSLENFIELYIANAEILYTFET